jgi:hypothetical protein
MIWQGPEWGRDTSIQIVSTRKINQSKPRLRIIFKPSIDYITFYCLSRLLADSFSPVTEYRKVEINWHFPRKDLGDT